MKIRIKKLSLSFVIIFMLVFSLVFQASATINWGTKVYISSYGQVVNSITYKGITVNSIYAPRSQVANYDGDSTFCCAAFVSKFYRSVYGIGVNNLYPGNTPNVYSGSGFFYKTSSPAVGDIAASSGHWAIVKEVSGNTVTLIEQNAWNTAYTHATVNRKLILPESSYWFWRYSLRDESTTTKKVDLGDNFYAAIINTERNKALTVEANNDVVMYTYTGAANQIWYFTKRNDGSYKILNCSNGLALDVYNGITSGWANVWTCESNDTSAQKWSFYGDAPYMFVSAECNSAVLDVADAKYDDGTNICINTKTGHNAQLFKVVQVNAPSIGEMTIPTITLDKKSYQEGDMINVSWAKTSSNTDFYQYWVTVQNPNGTTIHSSATGNAGDVNKNYFSFKADLKGKYKINVWSVPYNNKEQRQKYASVFVDVECKHVFSEYISDNNASYIKDGTKTAYCDKNCGKTNTITEQGSKLKPGKISKITATQSTSVIKLKWNAVEGATGYRVYQYSPSKGKYVKIASVKGVTTYRKTTYLKAGTTYKFKIKAYKKLADGTVVWGDASPAFATATECKAPTIKSIASPSKSKATVKWSNVEGETGFQLYYSTKKDSGYKKVNSYSTDTLTASKTFSNSASGKTIYFKVRAYKKVNGQTIFSQWSNIKSVKLK